jgi:hypothetical protein
LNQIQDNYPEFHYPLLIKIEYENGKSEVKRININSRNQDILIDVDKEAKDLILDPDNNLLAIFTKVNEN